MLLIFPPVAKPCEPPAGIARLAGALQAHGIPCRQLDANQEGLLWLFEQPPDSTDTWSRRAHRSCHHNLALLRSPDGYGQFDRYAMAVRDLNRLLVTISRPGGGTVGLADFNHETFTPISSVDLLAAAGQPESNPFFGYFSRRLPELLAQEDTVGFSLNYLSQALTTFAMIGHVRREFPRIRIILGGGLVTSWMSRSGWTNPFAGMVDDLVAGPGEQTLLRLLAPEMTDHVATTPDYGAATERGYLSPGFILPYSAAAGCWWNQCSFCPEKAEGNRYRPIPAPHALRELQLLTATTSPVLIHLLDNAVSPSLLTLLAETPPGAPWYGFARIDRTLEDPDFCRGLRRNGCVMLKLGLESGDQGVLESMNKGIDVVMAERVLQNLRSAGIAVYCYLLFGTPGETEREARQTLDFVSRNHQAISFLNLAIFNMPIEGPESAEYGTHLFYEADLSLYTGFRHPKGWDRRQVRQFLEKEFKRHPAVAGIIRHDPPFFGSNHAPFFSDATLFRPANGFPSSPR